jgi:hypothetical protein
MVHGGLTYSDKCSGHICHVGDEKNPVWWFGFDCAHLGDFIPGYLALEKELSTKFNKTFTDPSNKYWAQEDVMKETMRLAKHVAAGAKK